MRCELLAPTGLEELMGHFLASVLEGRSASGCGEGALGSKNSTGLSAF